MRILILPDAHVHPNYPNHRFDYLGKFLLDKKPDVLVCLGDFADMPSLSSYDRGTKGFEGRRYRIDLEHVRNALERMKEPMGLYSASAKRRKKAQYSPRMVITLGNHEDRITRAVNASPELEGTIGVRDLGLEEAGFEVYPFKEAVIIGGIAFCHFFPSGDQGLPIGGINVAASLIAKNHMSSVVGHNHRLDFAEHVRPDGTRLFGLSAGCYAHQQMSEDWNRNTYQKWWRGVIVLDGVEDGEFRSIEMVRMEALKEKYG